MEQIMNNNNNNRVSSLNWLIILFYLIILNWVIILQDFYLSFCNTFQSLSEFLVFTWNVWSHSNKKPTQKLCFCKNEEKKQLRVVELEMVMENLDNFCEEQDEIDVLFEEEEPRMEEVREAFEVFDENGDGFIDAMELKKVLLRMGYKDMVGGFRFSSEMEECEKMIRVFDENGDGRIDFDEFVKLIEKSFC